ncbi:hypothetical protein B0H03_1374 [Rathayibacter iranicus NCPPB 2253 = VKM Ac-1602]|uniref:Uncharacterized protein n=1 Tax=Rathayibacter iranicus NCPPB 2253 = VKM Ac-1602 TaxID=1328868 RepID=A0ABX5LDC0_9MICO|nr:hypothetical protein B0H03_1374 [Rathayibacter iranicus NCPPB 2253 = VKM Ac-1602]
MTARFDRSRPNRVPFARAAAMPALTRSTMSSLFVLREHVQHQPTRRGRRVDAVRGRRVDAVRDRPDLHPALTQQVPRVQDVDQRPTEPVDSPDDDGVPVLGVLEELLHPAPLDRGLAPRCHVREHVPFLHPRGRERVDLQLRVLIRRTHTRVTGKPHHLILTLKHPPRRVLKHSTARQLYETDQRPRLRARPASNEPAIGWLDNLMVFKTPTVASTRSPVRA